MSAHPTTAIDIAKLLAADNVSTADRIWSVDFEAKMPAELITEEDLKCPDCGEVHDPSLENARVVADTITVLGGPDAQVSVDWVREYILNRELEAGLHMTDFVLTGIKLLAAAEVVECSITRTIPPLPSRVFMLWRCLLTCSAIRHSINFSQS